MENKILRHQLSNGLTILGEQQSSSQSGAIGFFVKTGARDETEKESGVSHFLEHMVFKGTPSLSALDIAYRLGNLGAQANAYTSEESTVFYSAVIPEYFPDMLHLLSDMMRPALDPHEYDLEKKVILEEIALYQDKPDFDFMRKALTLYFNGHKSGNSVLGTSDSITALTRDEMHTYFSRRYSAKNITLVGAGKFDWTRFIADAEKCCGEWPSQDTPRVTSRYSRKPDVSQTIRKQNLAQARIMFVTEGCSAQDEERYPIGLLAMILGDSSGSKLYWELVETGLAEGAWTDSDELDGAGVFMAYASMEEKNLDTVRDIMRKILSGEKKFNDDDLSRAKTKLISKVVLSGELPMGRMMSLGTSWTYRKEVIPLSETIAKIKAVTEKDIHAALERFPLKDWSEYVLLPE